MRYGTEKRSGMHVDYADVLRQAVENERFRVLRAVYAYLDAEPVSERTGSSYSTRDISAKDFRDSVERKIRHNLETVDN